MFPFGQDGSEMSREQFQQVVNSAQMMATSQAASMEVKRDTIWEFFLSLEPDELIIMRQIMGAINTMEDVAHFDGHFVALLRINGVCQNCGVNHDAQAMAAMEAEVKSKTEEKPLVDDDIDLDENGDELFRNLQKYEVYHVAGYPGDKRVQCKNCTYVNPSLEDRMLRAPGIMGCVGCILRAGQG